ncbi:MAG: NAD-dependent epimerase/dehydratase family protein [Vicinamibacterales bacterium]
MTDIAIPAGTRVLITGATGFTGTALTRLLLSHGAVVCAIARPSSNLAPLAGTPVEWVRGEVDDPATIRTAARDVQYIFHVAAAYRHAGVSDDVYERVHVRSTERLAREVAGRSEFQRFVFVSTIGVHGHIASPPGNEDTPFAPGDLYQRTKAEAETWLRDEAATLGLPYTIVRPCAIYGPGDTRLLKVFRMAARGWFLALGTGRTLYHLVHVDDLVAIIERAALHPRALSRAFIAGASEPIRLDDMAHTIGGSLGRTVRIVRCPAGPVFVLADLCERVCKPLGLEPPLHRRRVAFYTKDRAFDTSRVRRELGYECRVSNADGLASTARWYKEQGWL